MMHNLGTEVIVIESKRKAIIVASKDKPYKSPIDFSTKYPQDDKDYLIMHMNEQGTFSGEPCNVRIDQIELLQK